MSAKLIVLIVCAVAHLSLGGIIQSASNKNFAKNLYLQIARNNIDKNIVLAPISIRTALGVTYMGADGQTAEELVQVLNLPSNDKIKVGEYFLNLLGVYTDDVKLTVANKIFLNTGYTLRPSFNELALKYFETNAQIVNFGQRQQAIDTINSWVSQKTNNKIQKIVEQESVDQGTAAIIASAAHFKGSWEQVLTRVSRRKFYAIQGNSIEVDTLSITEKFLYADLPELDATGVRVPYKNSDLYLLVLLPNQRNGLSNLLQKIDLVQIEDILARFSLEDVQISLPKFRIEYKVELKQVLEQLGIRSIFGNSANLNGLVQSGPPVKISDVLHKAVIEIEEKGTEAAASTGARTVSYSTNVAQKNFNADHPFVFSIRGPKGVYLVGQVVKV